MTIVILGSGKMACSIGAFFMGIGHDVLLATGDEHRLDVLKKRCHRLTKRAQRVTPEGAGTLEPRSLDRIQGRFDLCIESTHEDPQKKAKVLRGFFHRAEAQDIVSTSSSITPSRIHDRCTGMHFFYPVALTMCVECIFPAHTTADRRHRLTKLCTASGLTPLIQNECDPFLVNRLLLAPQVEAARLYRAGIPKESVVAWSQTDLTPHSPFAMLEQVGMETISSAVKNYTTLPWIFDSVDLTCLKTACDWFCRHAGAVIPPVVPASLADDTRRTPEDTAVTPDHFTALLINGFAALAARNLMDISQMETVCSGPFQAEHTLVSTALRLGVTGIVSHLERWYARTGLSYFKPDTKIETFFSALAAYAN